jgi:hypothetical protein
MEKNQNFRSPPYPTMSLEKAIEKARQLREVAKGYTVPLISASKAWGFSEKSSSTTTVAAALNQYGLVADEGSRDDRRVGLSQLADTIIMDVRPTSVERDAAIREAALSPKVFKELWERFQTAEVDTHTLIYELTLGRKKSNRAPFSEAAAAELARIYRETIAFARFEGATLAATSEPESGAGPIAHQDQSDATVPRGPAGAAGNEKYRELYRPKDDQFEEKKSLDEGEAILIWPRELSKDSVEDMEYWLNGVLKQIKRRVEKAG